MRDVRRKIEETKTDLEDMNYYCTDLRNSLDSSQNVMNEVKLGDIIHFVLKKYSHSFLVAKNPQREIKVIG